MKRLLHTWPRDAWLTLAARAAMMAVNALVLVALMLRIHDAGLGPLANTGLMAALAAPPVLTVRLAGWVADRYDSRRILLAALGAQAVAALALAASTDLLWTYAWALVFEAGFSFSSPVWLALVPRIVGDERVQGLAGAQMLASSLTAPLGAAAGGFLVEAAGTRTPPLAAAAGIGLALAAALAIGTRRSGASASGPGAASAAVGGGLAAIRRDPVLASILAGGIVLVLVVQGVNVVEVFLVRDALGASPAQFGLGELFFAAGSIAASFVVARLRSDRLRVAGVLGGFGLSALVCVGIGLVPTFPGYLGLLVALGLFNAVANGGTGPLFLLRTPEELRGRVMAALGGSFAAASLVALVFGGLAGTWLGPRVTFVAGGGLAFLVVLGMAAVSLPAVAAAPQPAGSTETDQPAGRPSR